MRAHFSTQPLYYLLSPPINSRFAVHHGAISQPYGTPSDEGGTTTPTPPSIRASAGMPSTTTRPVRPSHVGTISFPRRYGPGSSNCITPSVTRKAGA